MQNAGINHKKIFSNNLQYYMKVNGKTQSDIINDLNINKSVISSWYHGTRLPRMNKIQILADYFNINVSDLIEEKNMNKSIFEFIIEDDSMYPIMDKGDIAYIISQDHLDNTSNFNKGFYLIKINKILTIRQIIKNENETFYKLVAKNPCYKDIIIPENIIYYEIEIIGKVIKAENQSAFI